MARKRKRKAGPAGGEATGAAGAWLPSLRVLRRHRQLLESWAIFIGILALVVAFSEWAGDLVNVRVPEWTARSTAWALNALGQDAQVDGVIVSCSICTFEIIGECTAFLPAAILVAAVLASPCSWRSTLLGLGLGIPAIYLINMLRLVSLCFIFRHYPQAFETAHVLVWQSLIVFVTMLLWLLWFAVLARPGARARSARAASAR